MWYKSHRLNLVDRVNLSIIKGCRANIGISIVQANKVNEGTLSPLKIKGTKIIRTPALLKLKQTKFNTSL
jgi:hypothetical protein